MSGQTLIVLDNPPLDRDPWADAVFARIDCTAVDNDAISTLMSKDPAARELLLANADDPIAHAEQLAPLYARALRQLHGDATRLGLYGTAWLVYADIDACVLDWSEVEKRATAPGVPEDPGEYFRQQSHAFIDARTARYLEPGQLLELPTGLADDERVERAVSFLQARGVA